MENPLRLTISPEDTLRDDWIWPNWSNTRGINPFASDEFTQITGYDLEDWIDVAKMLDDDWTVSALKEAGFDGVIFLDEEAGFVECYAVFEPSQIISPKTFS